MGEHVIRNKLWEILIACSYIPDKNPWKSWYDHSELLLTGRGGRFMKIFNNYNLKSSSFKWKAPVDTSHMKLIKLHPNLHCYSGILTNCILSCLPIICKWLLTLITSVTTVFVPILIHIGLVGISVSVLAIDFQTPESITADISHSLHSHLRSLQAFFLIHIEVKSFSWSW